MNLLVVEKPREKQLQQIRGDQADGALGWQVLSVQMVDSPMSRIGCEQLLRQLCHRDMHPASIPHPPLKRKLTGGPQNRSHHLLHPNPVHAATITTPAMPSDGHLIDVDPRAPGCRLLSRLIVPPQWRSGP